MKPHIKLPDPIPFTKEGYENIKTDLELYTQKRKTAVVNLRTARDMGDLSENAAYKAARFELSSIDRKLRQLKFLLRFGVITSQSHGKIADFGSEITVKNEASTFTFHLVGGYESNPNEKKLSVKSPIGRAVFHRKLNDTISVDAPSGKITYTIVEIK